MTSRDRSTLVPIVAPMFTVALILFVFTIIVGILNGMDVYEPDHDTLMTHVHAGTLGWITLAVSGTAMLIFTQGTALGEAETRSARMLSWAMALAIFLYVVAFFAGDRIPGDRIQRPIFGSILFVVVIWFGVWLWKRNRSHDASSVVRLGLSLAWVSLIIGSTLGVLLGIFSARGEVPGLPDDTASALADAHPPSMVIGFLILAAVAITEWIIRDARTYREDRAGVTQMLLIFVAGVTVIVALTADIEPLLGPANLLEIVGVVMLVVRLRKQLAPAGWRDAGTSIYGRVSIVFLALNLVVLTYLVSQVIAETMDFDALTESQEGLLLTLDHLMFIGVMTVALFGVIAKATGRHLRSMADNIVLWGIVLGITGFAIGLLTVTPAIKRVATPVLGVALLIGIGAAIMELRSPARTE
jgi:hypothetical protein